MLLIVKDIQDIFTGVHCYVYIIIFTAYLASVLLIN